MRRLLVLALLLAAGWYVVERRRGRHEHVVVGFADGSTVAPERGTPAWERAVAAARAVRPA
jgi:hypothetical protein